MYVAGTRSNRDILRAPSRLLPFPCPHTHRVPSQKSWGCAKGSRRETCARLPPRPWSCGLLPPLHKREATAATAAAGEGWGGDSLSRATRRCERPSGRYTLLAGWQKYFVFFVAGDLLLRASFEIVEATRYTYRYTFCI